MRTIWIGALTICALGCSHHPAPTRQVAASMASVRGAEEAGALNVPEGALHVKLAQDQLNAAQELMKEEKNREAERMALRADSDAELAVAIARNQQARTKLEQFAQADRSAGGEATPAQTTQGAAQ